MDEIHIARIRQVLFVITGGVCLTYAILAILWNTPNPMPRAIPGFLGVVSAFLLFGIGLFAPKKTKLAFDEGYRHNAQRAASLAYWVSLFGFVIFFLSYRQLALDLSTAVASFGTFMGAAYLLSFAYLDWRFA